MSGRRRQTAAMLTVSLLLACGSASARTRPASHPRPRASDYLAGVTPPAGVELRVDVPSPNCVDLSSIHNPLAVDTLDAADALDVIMHYRRQHLEPLVTSLPGIVGISTQAESDGEYVVIVLISRVAQLPAYVVPVMEMVAHYPSPRIQVCGGYRTVLLEGETSA